MVTLPWRPVNRASWHHHTFDNHNYYNTRVTFLITSYYATEWTPIPQLRPLPGLPRLNLQGREVQLSSFVCCHEALQMLVGINDNVTCSSDVLTVVLLFRPYHCVATLRLRSSALLGVSGFGCSNQETVKGGGPSSVA